MLLRNRKYEVKAATEEYVKKFRFNYMIDISNHKEKYYNYSFPVYKYNNKTLLYCDLIIRLGDTHVEINVYNTDGSVYAAWYNSELAKNNKVVEQVNASILGRLKKMDIVEVRENDNTKRRDVSKVCEPTDDRREEQSTNNDCVPAEG